VKNPAIFPQPQKKMDLSRLWEVQEKISENLDRFVDMAIRYELAINPEFKITIFESVDTRATPKFSTETVDKFGMEFLYVEYDDQSPVYLTHFRIDDKHFRAIRPDINVRGLDLTAVTHFMAATNKNWLAPAGVFFGDSTSTSLSDLTEAYSAREYNQKLKTLTRLSNWLSANVGWHSIFDGPTD
jgi:hypothetical protein